MLNKLENIKIPFVESIEIKFLLLFGLVYRLLIFAVYTTVSKWPDSWGFMVLSEYLLKFDLTGYNGERSPGYALLIFLGFGTMKITIIYQFIIGIFTSIYWYKTVLNLKFNKSNALLITLFIESFLHVFFYETSILVESLALFFLFNYFLSFNR